MLKYNRETTRQSTQIPMGVYDIDALEAELRILNLPVTRPNIRRIRRAIDLHQRGAVVNCVGSVHHSGRSYSVKSQSTDEIYEVEIDPAGDTTCTCPDSAENLNLCKHQMAVMLHEEQRRDQEMCDKWEANQAECEANRGCTEDMCEGKRAAHLAEAPDPYQVAKARINQLPDISYDRPDSLTRRNGHLIARFRYGFHWKPKAAQADWQSVITRLFPTSRIIKTTVDRKRIARCYFSLD